MFYGFIFSHNHVCNCAIENVILLGFDKYLPKIFIYFHVGFTERFSIIIKMVFFLFLFLFFVSFFFLLYQHVLADVWVARMQDLGTNDCQYHCRTHLGHLLKTGDAVLG